MSSKQEKKFYLQLWSFTTGPAIRVMQHFFEVKILNNTFETFLNDRNNMHTLFHQCFPKTPCCYCSIVSLASPKKKGHLDFLQFDMLYDNSGLATLGHEKMKGTYVKQHCICKYSAKYAMTIDHLDIPLLCSIVRSCCPTKMNLTWRKNIKDVRNFLAHVGNCQVIKSDFENHWKTLEIATLGFASEIGTICKQMFQDEISRVQTYSTDQLKEMLEKSNENVSKMLKDLNGLKPLQTTIEECKTTIELGHVKQEAQLKELKSSITGQSKVSLTEVNSTCEENKRGICDLARDMGEVKHKINNFESIIQLVVEREMDKKKTTSDASRKITVSTQVDSSNWDEENTIRNISNMEKTEISRGSCDTKKFFVKNVENKCIRMELVAFPDVFQNPQNLRKALRSLIDQLVEAGEIDTYTPGTLRLNLKVKTPLSREEIAVVHSVFDKNETLEESTETVTDVKPIVNDDILLTLKVDPDNFGKSYTESHLAETIEEVKKYETRIDLKDNFVTCQHCEKGFSCEKCMSKIKHIRRLKQGLLFKERTIQRLEKALTKEEKGMSEDDEFVFESDQEPYYSVDKNAITEEPERKKRKKSSNPEVEMPTGESEMSNRKDSNILVDTNQALKKLGEVPLIDYKVKEYKKCLKKFEKEWTGHKVNAFESKKQILENLLLEKKQRTSMIEKLKDIVHNQDELTCADKDYYTDVGFLHVENPVTKCEYCHTEEESRISCVCTSCNIIICDGCVNEHRIAHKEHHYLYRYKLLRGYAVKQSWHTGFNDIIDVKCLFPNMVVILTSDFCEHCTLATYDCTGELTNKHTFSIEDYRSRIACINDSKVAITLPNAHLIHIVTIVPTIVIEDIQAPTETTMTGGITCREDILYVAYSDAIRLITLSGRIQRIINIPMVTILHYVNNDMMNNDMMLCVYSKDYSDKTVACLQLTNDHVSDFEQFPFHPDGVTTDDVGNIIFITDGVIWQADKNGKNAKIMISPADSFGRFNVITYDKLSNVLVTIKVSDKEVIRYQKLQ